MNSRDSFTLIELLVTILLIALAVGIAAPYGSKILNSFKNKFYKHQQAAKIKKARLNAVISSRQITIVDGDQKITINKKGEIIE